MKNDEAIKFIIPDYIISILRKLEEAGIEAYLVGGCVRDLLMDNPPAGGVKDWDIATNAKPEEIVRIFPDSVYENEFGTVGIKIKIDANLRMECESTNSINIENKTEIVEVTTFRIESKYSDKRHPDGVKFAKTLKEDLSRRDFTVNAMALKISNFQFPISNKISNYKIIDLFDGQEDLKNKIIRAVGDAGERFNEDALRMMRAIRFASTLNGIFNFQFSTLPTGRQVFKQISNSKYQIRNNKLNWKIEEKTLEAIKKNAKNIEYVSRERIKDELIKIILSDNPSEGIDMLHKTGLLDYIIPELKKGVDMAQNRHHIYTIYKHNLLSLKFCPSKKLETRLAALLHDIAKPQTKRGEGEFATFYNHDHVGARVARKILERLKFSRNIIDKVFLLVDNHMFYYNPEEVSESSVRRLIQKVGLENMKDLLDLRISDRLGSGVPKAKPYKLRHMEYIIDKVSTDAVSVKMLKINGNDLMKDLNIASGPIIGAIMDVLLSEVIEDASKNNRENLLFRAKELMKLDLEKLRQMAKKKIEEKKEEDDEEIKKKHWVR
ncbi:MAG TPA: hypothetical protein DCS28_02165 [Candidatus Moranbacteria bacterium]|nr:hypothetical protein [Candidatus Moranbacteria bacterium]HAT74819.1 hypothetical protein [Candidatus Moranbacteria bacterium]